TEYVIASRRGASRRQRIVLGSVIAALAVTLALAVFALVKRSEAIHDAKIARSRELAALSLGASGSDARQVLRLALDATEEATTPEAEDALRSALVRTRLVASVAGAADSGAVFVAGGTRVRYACPDASFGELVEGQADSCPATGRKYLPVVFAPGGA